MHGKFMKNPISSGRLLGLCLALALTGATPGAGAESVMHGIDARNASLTTFQSRVHVNLRLLSFPWLYSKLDGTEYYKRPDKHGVVFDNPPSYARGIKSLFGAVDQPSEWRKDSNISLTGRQTLNGRTVLVLRMTKKIYSDQIKDTIAYVDASTFEVVRMEFNYTNGDAITMTQTYRELGAYSVVTARHLEIKRHVRAVADETFANFQANIAVSDAVFEQK